MYIRNIRELKKSLRAQSRRFRERLEPERKAAMDAEIVRRLASLKEYRAAPVLYTYVSKQLEVDTLRLIERAAADGKRVAVPRCIPETLEMQFYEINSVSDLAPGCYGVLEPVEGRCRPARSFRDALCIVPGLSFDSQGYRLGYGKGYYDRFLSDFCGATVGLCYSGCTRWNLPHGYFDRPVNVLITEKCIRRIPVKPEEQEKKTGERV